MKKMRNSDIKNMIKSSGVKMWKIAEAYGVTDSTFSRKLRYQLTDEERTKIINIIRDLTTDEILLKGEHNNEFKNQYK